MNHCSLCGAPRSQSQTECPHCRAVAPDRRDDAHNPYAPPIAEIQTDLPPASHRADYQIPFGGGATLRAAFHLWKDSLGHLVVVNLLPVPMIVVIVTVTTIVLFANAAVGLFDGIASVETFLQSQGPMVGIGIVLASISAMVLFIPSFAAQFLILDEMARQQRITIGVWRAYLKGFRSVLPILGVFTIVYLGILALIFPVILLGDILPVLPGIVLLGLIPVLMILALRLMATIPYIVVDRFSMWRAIGASIDLTRGHSSQLLGTTFLFGLIIVGLSLANMIAVLVPFIGVFVQLAFQLMIIPLQAAFIFAIYAGLKTLNRPKE